MIDKWRIVDEVMSQYSLGHPSSIDYITKNIFVDTRWIEISNDVAVQNLQADIDETGVCSDEELDHLLFGVQNNENH